MARAIYARPSLLVLDDIFGPLDGVTSRIVFQRVLGRAGLARRLGIAAVLVTTAGESNFDMNNHGADSSFYINSAIFERSRLSDCSFKRRSRGS